MIRQFIRSFVRIFFVVIFSYLFSVAPVSATTFSFHSPGESGEEGVMVGQITYDKDAVNLALNNPKNETYSLSLEELGKNREFKFEYISPYSGVKHTENTICPRNIGDINNSDKPNISIGGKEGPFFQFNSFDELASFNFVSCVGERGKLGSSISERDKSVAFSELQVVFGQAKLIDADYGGTKSGRRYTKSFPVSLELEAN